ncbi:MAG: hypothetical protein NTX66_01360 [Candidatus Falkowbacteria bacterium]|nr:hypothetical protein [Candidatus Falkowbacteria bacterium]
MKKLLMPLLILLLTVNLFGSCKKEEQPQSGIALDFKELRGLTISNLSVVDSAETTSIRLNGREIYFYKWQTGFENSTKVRGRIEYAEYENRQFLLVGGEVFFDSLIFIRSNEIRQKLAVNICSIKTAVIKTINFTEYLELVYNNRWIDRQNAMPDESTLTYLPE